MHHEAGLPAKLDLCSRADVYPAQGQEELKEGSRTAPGPAFSYCFVSYAVPPSLQPTVMRDLNGPVEGPVSWNMDGGIFLLCIVSDIKCLQ